MSDNKVTIPLITARSAAERALQEIEQEREGKQLGLKTRYNALNVAMRKYFRFNSVNLFAGLSGHGKSYFLNILTEDFLNDGEGGINSKVEFKTIVLHFCFEMSSYNEILRACANDLGINYNYLLSSHYDKNEKTYNRLSDEELLKVKEFLRFYSKKSILFFEISSNVNIIWNTIEKVCETFLAKARKFNSENAHLIQSGEVLLKEYKFVINLDHTLLVEQMGEKSALELMANIGKVAIRIRKTYAAMVNLVGQLNNNIEATERLLKSTLHYPQKSDIYAQGQLYNACDSVFVIHQPSMLKIKFYGTDKRPTKGLIHFLVLKARHGNIGSIWFLNLLSRGTIIPLPKPDTTAIDDENLDNV